MWKKVSSSNEILQKGERPSHRREGLNDPQVEEIVKNLAQGLWRHAFSLPSINSCRFAPYWVQPTLRIAPAESGMELWNDGNN